MSDLASSALDRLLAFIDRPWKAVAVALLILVGLIGFTAYEQRAQIADAILRREVKPTLEPKRFTEDVPRLLRETRGDVAMLIEIKLANNSARDVEGLDSNGKPWLPLPGPRLVLDTDFEAPTSASAFAQFIMNNPVCFEVRKDSPSAERQAEAALGVRRACIVAVPPILGVLIGALYVGWYQPPAPALERNATVAMTDAAMRFATW